MHSSEICTNLVLALRKILLLPSSGIRRQRGWDSRLRSYNSVATKVTGSDLSEAVHWYRRAALQDDAEASYFLGDAYNRGEGVGQDPSEALRWFRKSPDLGFARAQELLGRLYQSGFEKLVPREPTESVR